MQMNAHARTQVYCSMLSGAYFELRLGLPCNCLSDLTPVEPSSIHLRSYTRKCLEPRTTNGCLAKGSKGHLITRSPQRCKECPSSSQHLSATAATCIRTIALNIKSWGKHQGDNTMSQTSGLADHKPHTHQNLTHASHQGHPFSPCHAGL